MATAEARVEAVQYQPGTNNVRAAQGKALKLLTDARTRADSPEPSKILDALAERLSSEGRQGLTQYRKTLRADARALTALESELGKGADLNSFLSHRGVSAVQAEAAKVSYSKAIQQLARLELIEMKAMSDRTLRQAVSNEIARQELEKFMGSELVEGVCKEMDRLQAEQLQDPNLFVKS